MIAMGLSSLLNPALKIMVFVVIAPVLHWIVAGNLLDIIAMEAFGTALSLINACADPYTCQGAEYSCDDNCNTMAQFYAVNYPYYYPNSTL